MTAGMTSIIEPCCVQAGGRCANTGKKILNLSRKESVYCGEGLEVSFGRGVRVLGRTSREGARVGLENLALGAMARCAS